MSEPRNDEPRNAEPRNDELPPSAETDGLRTIVCFGDSNTYGWDPELGATGGRLGRDARWPGVLRRELGPGYDVIEEGLGGRTAGVDDPYSEFRDAREQILPILWSHAPIDLVAIMLGTNDLKETFHLSAVDIARAANLLVELAVRSLAGPGDTPPHVLLIAPAPLGPATSIAESSGFLHGIDESQRLGRLYREVAEGFGVAFLDAGEVASVSPLDGVHLDAAACRSLGLAVAAIVRRIFEARSV
jgi:lysophospholipase L1-like esterase